MRRHRRRHDRDGGRLHGRRRLRGSTRLGGFDLDTAIQDHLRRAYDVAIGEKSAEEIKIAIGSAFPAPRGRAAIVTGRALATGAPTEIRVTEDEIRQAMSSPSTRSSRSVRRTIAEAPPELTHDVLEAGMFLTGGGGLLRGSTCSCRRSARCRCI